jgi:hypothetical protein
MQNQKIKKRNQDLLIPDFTGFWFVGISEMLILVGCDFWWKFQ